MAKGKMPAVKAQLAAGKMPKAKPFGPPSAKKANPMAKIRKAPRGKKGKLIEDTYGDVPLS